jgi:hypothetical protein
MRRAARLARFPSRAAACVLVAALLLVPACGKKGPPIPADADEAQVPPGGIAPATPAPAPPVVPDGDDAGDDTEGTPVRNDVSGGASLDTVLRTYSGRTVLQKDWKHENPFAPSSREAAYRGAAGAELTREGKDRPQDRR